MPPAPANSNPSDDLDIDQSIAQLEQSFTALKQRYDQVKADQQQQQDLQQRLEQTQRSLQHASNRSDLNRSGLNRSDYRSLKAELKQIQQQLEEVELRLESQLFAWNGLREVFWQAVRFGGLGIVIGWLLRGWAS